MTSSDKLEVLKSRPILRSFYDHAGQLHQENMSMKSLTILTQILYKRKGVRRGIHIFLFLIQNIDCGYSLTYNQFF